MQGNNADDSPAAQAAAAAAAEAVDSVTLRVPRQTAVALHYPGFIANPDKALQTLGGAAALSRSLQDEAAFLKLRLRPDDSHSHPLFGERIKQPGLLLRVSRPAGQPDAEPTVTVAARLGCCYAFNGLADYQFLGKDQPASGGRDLARLSARNQPAAAEPFRSAQPLLLVPPIFSKVDLPVAFAFRDQAPPKESDAAASSSRKRIVSFYERSLPPALPLPGKQQQRQQQQQQQQEESEAGPSQTQQQQQQQQQEAAAAAGAAAGACASSGSLEQQLQQLLQERPAWPLELLLQRLPGATEEQLLPLLQAMCYQFKTGPWKLLYLRCGFDPRSSPDSRQYQLVSYRLPGPWSKRVKAAKQAGRPMQQPPLSQLHSFSAMPVSHTTLLQLCDLAPHNQALQQLIEMAPLPVGPSEAYGWFTYNSSQQLHHAVSLAFQKTLQAINQQQAAEAAEAAAAESGDAMDVDQPAAEPSPAQQQEAAAAAARPPQQQQRSRRQRSAAGAGQAAAAAAAAAAGEDVVGLLGLGAAEDELQQWLREAAAAAEARRGSGAGNGGVSDGEASTDAGLSDSDWATSGGETTADETDGTDFEEAGYNGGGGGEESEGS